MKQVVAIHQAMFEKLLFDKDAAVSLDLAELFHDAGRTYLQIAERITAMRPLDARAQLSFLKSRLATPGYRPRLEQVTPGHYVAEHD